MSPTVVSSRSALWPTPPPRTTRSGSSTAATAATVWASRSPSWRTAATAAGEPERAASNTDLADSGPVMPSARAARTTASAETASSSVPGSRPGHGRKPISPAAPFAPVNGRPPATMPMPSPVPIIT